MDAKSYVVGLLTGTIVVLVAALVATFAFCNCCCDSSNACCVPPGCCSEQCHKELEARVEKLERQRTGAAETEQ